ncbi:MAG TPA: ABC transporter transmembrane domain-containing protein, partial [Longimicrobiaceae bacterium]
MRRSLALPLGLLRRERGVLVRFAAASLGRTALTAASFLLVREFLGGAVGERGGLWTLAGLLLAAHLGAAALTYASQVSQQKLVKTIELGVMERLIRQLLGLSAGFFDRRTHGDLIQAVRQDVTQLRAFTLAAAKVALDSLQAVGLVVTAAVLSPTLALCAFVVVPLAVGPVVLIARRTLARSYGVRRGGVVLFDVLLQLFAGIRIVKVYAGEQAEAGRAVERARR